MFDRLEDLLIRFEEIMSELNEPFVVNDQTRFQKLMKEQSDLQPIVDAYKEYKESKQTVEDSLSMLEEESDEEMREMLKEELNDAKKNIFGGGFSGRSAGAGGGSRSYHFGGGFGDGFSGGNSGFGNDFGSGNSGFGDGFSGTGSSFGGRGSDLHADITVSFDEAALGGDKVINLSDPSAPGRTQSLQVHIPAGIDDGQSIRLRGKGQMGRNGQAGDLLLKVKIAEKPGFERKGMDVYTTVNVPFSTAVLGGEAKVHTLYGDVICKVREGTQSGSKIRLRGKGIVSMKNPQVHGDHYVTVQVQVPRNITPEARRKLREFEQACGIRNSYAG